ncbi:hypothetical protein ACROYT_G033588 [Oculina patagonica]
MHNNISMYSVIYLMLHNDLSHASPSPSSSKRSCSPRTTERRRNATEYSTIQKDSIQCLMDTNNISGLLFSVCYRIYICYYGIRHAILFLRLGSYNISFYVKLNSKSVFVLLEDEGSETSSEEHARNVLLFLKLTVQSYRPKFNS